MPIKCSIVPDGTLAGNAPVAETFEALPRVNEIIVVMFGSDIRRLSVLRVEHAPLSPSRSDPTTLLFVTDATA